MLPRLSELRLKAAPVRVGTKPQKTKKEIEPSSILHFSNRLANRDLWIRIVEVMAEEEPCDERIQTLCKSRGMPWSGRCEDGTLYEHLNVHLGFYGSFKTHDDARAWYVARKEADPNYAKVLVHDDAPDATKNDLARLKVFTAQQHFEDVCADRRLYKSFWDLIKHQKDEGRVVSSGLERTYRLVVRHMVNPFDAPHVSAHAKSIVGNDPNALEFIPGSPILVHRYHDWDLLRSPDDPQLLDTKEKVYIKFSPIADYPEIAMIAVKLNGLALQHVPGSFHPKLAMQLGAPCEGFDEIVMAAVEQDGMALGRVPGSQPGSMLPEAYERPGSMLRFDGEGRNDLPIIPLQNYVVVAKVAAKTAHGAIRYVKGSISIFDGNQFYAPIDGYYEIAEAFVRKDGHALRWVPGSLDSDSRRDKSTMGKQWPIDGYKELVKLAFETDTAVKLFVPDAIMELEDVQKAYKEGMDNEEERRATRREARYARARAAAGTPGPPLPM
tara:strand:- start:1695 stop:3182 length:1488 start_codon:yes stop_codon:yes gene_type:complete